MLCCVVHGHTRPRPRARPCLCRYEYERPGGVNGPGLATLGGGLDAAAGEEVVIRQVNARCGCIGVWVGGTGGGEGSRVGPVLAICC